MISAPNTSSIWRRSIDTLSGMRMVMGLPVMRAMAASAMPVLPDDGSRMRWPFTSRPVAYARLIIAFAMRSFTEPNGFWFSNFANSRTAGDGESWLTSTSGVLPISSSTLDDDRSAMSVAMWLVMSCSRGWTAVPTGTQRMS